MLTQACYHHYVSAVAPLPPRERILQVTLALLESEGVEAISTRAVSAAAAVQPPTIYRQFGDMQGLLNAVASTGFASYLQTKAAHVGTGDPVGELREGWDRHVEFGLTHPHLYTLMYARLQPGEESPAALEAAAMLGALMGRVAEAGRLAVGVERAAAMVHASAVGVTLTLLGAQEQDGGLAIQMREAVLGAILTPEGNTAVDSTRQEAAAHAIALVALLPKRPVPFSEAERALLLEWLTRLI